MSEKTLDTSAQPGEPQGARPVKQEKAWGTTEALLRNPFVQVHRIHVEKGGFCSIHKHDARSNMFIVVKGVLTVKWHNSDQSIRLARHLHPGDTVAVPPGEFHSFEAVTDVEAFEVYWPEEVRDEDITRLNEGGILRGGLAAAVPDGSAAAVLRCRPVPAAPHDPHGTISSTSAAVEAPDAVPAVQSKRRVLAGTTQEK